MPIEIGRGGLSVTVEENVPAEMRDGTILRSDVYRPSRPGKYPVLLCRTPYDKSTASYVETAQDLCSSGYIVVVHSWHMGTPDTKHPGNSGIYIYKVNTSTLG
ncbi:MAG: CocE/NonD family hydrolase [Candidatus Poribacteria bacterium]|nr:CocE/NonD family hydrolase [Candidatus Poribacteria bacterium]